MILLYTRVKVLLLDQVKFGNKVVVLLSTGRQIQTPGSEIVTFSRASHITILAIGNLLREIDRISLLKIGKGKVCDKHKNFEILLSNYEITIKDYYVDKITSLDASVTKIYSGKYFCLLSWYRNKVDQE